MGEAERRAEIARLNDVFRFTGKGGRMFMTAGFDALSTIDKLLVLTEVRHFADFNVDNDPHGEHDCAVVTLGAHRIIWKIDYLPVNDAEEPDPANSEAAIRILTVMLAEEY